MDKKIEEQLIEFDTAKLARDKGLTRETLGYRTSSVRKDYYNHRGELNGDCTENINELLSKTKTSKYKLIAAPTQAVLQKWLREIHNIEIWIGKGGLNGDKYHAEDITKNGILVYENNEMFDTYEQALEKVLKEALKLIDK